MAQPTQKPTANTSAWNAFNSDAAEWCGGYGENDLPASLIAGCKRSTFIWALMTSAYNGNGGDGFLSNAASSKNSSSGVVNSYIDGLGNGSGYYNDARDRIEKLDTQHYSGGGMVIGCSYVWDDGPGITWGTQCSDLAMWDTKVHLGGATATDTYDTATEARLNCLLRCPTVDTSKADSNYHKWVRASRARASQNDESGWVPQENSAGDSMNGDTQAALSRRGAWCFSRPSDTQTVTRTKVTESDLPGATYPYLWRTEVADGTGTTHPGPTQFTPQTAGDVKTPYGQLLDNAAASETEPTATQIAIAGNATDAADHGKVTLTDSNKQWLAEGAVLNVTERTYYAYLSHYTRTEQPQKCTQIRGWAFTYSRWEDVTMTQGAWAGCGTTGTDWVNNGAFTLSEDYYIQAQTPELTNFFQAVSNHCNADGYALARGATNGRGTAIEQVANNDSSKNWSGSLLSAKITGTGAGDSPANHALWGAAGSDARGTGGAGFYDKECAYEGVKADGGPESTMQTDFRDNEFHDFAVDLYQPKAQGVVQEDAGQAVTTTVTRWLLGTPQVAQLENQGTFSMKNQAGEPMFSQGSEVAASPTTGQQMAPVQKDWDTAPFQSRNLSITAGQSSTFRVAANWPSRAARPQVFTVKWEYTPTVQNTLPTTVGFSAGGTRYYELTVEGARIQGKVNGKFGADESPATYGLQTANTGTGTSNKIDVPLYYGSDLDSSYQWKQDPHTYSPFYSSVRFVRAAGD
ncbi:hypothetical protein ASD30_25170 [Nocardioides sp. Root140]|nr:hypothetical protein ASD30_25170 [Nocardioides sp. Root140]